MNRNVVIGVLGASAAILSVESAMAQTIAVLNKSANRVSFVHPTRFSIVGAAKVDVGPHEAATSPDGKTIVVCNYGAGVGGRSLSILDASTMSFRDSVFLGEHSRPHGIQFLPDGERVIVTTEGTGSVLIVHLETAEIEAAIKTEQDVSHMVAITPDATRAFVANIGSGSVSVLDLENHSLIRNIPTGGGAEGIFMHPSRNEVWVTNRGANTVTILDAESLEITDEMECGDFPIRVAITPNGELALVSCARSGDVAVFDVETRELIKRIPMEAEALSEEEREKRLFGDQFGDSPVPVGILIEPDGSQAWVANTNADQLTVIDLETLEVSKRMRMPGEPDGMAWSRFPER